MPLPFCLLLALLGICHGYGQKGHAHIPPGGATGGLSSPPFPGCDIENLIQGDFRSAERDLTGDNEAAVFTDGTKMELYLYDRILFYTISIEGQVISIKKKDNRRGGTQSLSPIQSRKEPSILSPNSWNIINIKDQGKEVAVYINGEEEFRLKQLNEGAKWIIQFPAGQNLRAFFVQFNCADAVPNSNYMPTNEGSKEPYNTHKGSKDDSIYHPFKTVPNLYPPNYNPYITIPIKHHPTYNPFQTVSNKYPSTDNPYRTIPNKYPSSYKPHHTTPPHFYPTTRADGGTFMPHFSTHSPEGQNHKAPIPDIALIVGILIGVILLAIIVVLIISYIRKRNSEEINAQTPLNGKSKKTDQSYSQHVED